MSPTLGILLCDVVAPERLAIAGDYPDIFTNLFRAHAPAGRQATLRFYDVTAGQYPADLAECDGYLTNGAAASVNDPEPWIARFEQFVRRLHGHRIPLVGICFGHQMIAKALGGRVGPSERGWGVGIHEITVARHEPWMTPRANSFRIVASHQDQVLEAPPGAAVLASAPHCPVSLFRCGSLLGIQGHPEFSVAYARALLASRLDIIPPETVAAAHDSFAHPPDHALLVSWIVHFLECRERPSALP